MTNLQVGADAAGTPAAGEVGVIAYDPAARTAALADRIADGGGDQWRRATAQGVLALGAGLFVEVVATSGGPDGSTTTTSTGATPTSTTVVQAGRCCRFRCSRLFNLS
ncbi:MAG: hypothetical protein M5U19_19025, partial [Microthrixaceae bacterium]|nr:hypothetical protein [Microthrixaceae bacterium]